MKITNPAYIKEIVQLKEGYAALPWYPRFWFSLWSYNLSSALSSVDSKNPTSEQIQTLRDVSNKAWFFKSIFGLFDRLGALFTIPFTNNDSFNKIPDDIHREITSHLDESAIIALVETRKRMHALFQPKRLFDKFLQQVAYGEQDKAEKLVTEVFKGQAEKTQNALRYKGKFTDYSGRTFNCTAYEYAYWAKDTHMCRMLESQMNQETKAQMLVRINEIERIDEAIGKPVGLKYQQNGAENRSAHFDLTPLITALQEYLNGQNAWLAANNRAAMKAAWRKVGMTQRDVPAHVAQEYCRLDRSFFPLPTFNVDTEDALVETLPRVLVFYNWKNCRDDSCFPLASRDSGLGFGFTLIRGARERPVGYGDVGFGGGSGGRGGGFGSVGSRSGGSIDLAAIIRLDEVRTIDLTRSRDHLNPPASTPGMSM